MSFQYFAYRSVLWWVIVTMYRKDHISNKTKSLTFCFWGKKENFRKPHHQKAYVSKFVWFSITMVTSCVCGNCVFLEYSDPYTTNNVLGVRMSYLLRVTFGPKGQCLVLGQSMGKTFFFALLAETFSEMCVEKKRIKTKV